MRDPLEVLPRRQRFQGAVGALVKQEEAERRHFIQVNKLTAIA